MKSVSRDAVNCSIIGTGAVGIALALGLMKTGVPVRSLISRKPERQTLPGPLRNLPLLTEEMLDSDNTGNLIFLTVPDDRIPEVAGRLVSSHPALFAGRSVVHCSGSTGSDVLNPLQDLGAKIASFHPLQTFPRASGPERLRGITISIEGDSMLCKQLETVAERLEATPLKVTRSQKQALHIAAVFLSNYLVTLGDVADRIVRDALPEAGFEILRPLLAQTTENLLNDSPHKALTGPVSRGDEKTVLAHLDWLESRADTARLYRLMGLETVRLAEQSSDFSEEKADRLRQLFTGRGSL